MAFGIKLIFGAISILLGLVWICGFNGSIADRFDRYTGFRTNSDALIYSNLETFTQAKLNDSVVREIRRNVIFEKDNSRISNLPRNAIDLNLRSYFREKNPRIEEAFSRNRRIERLRSQNFDIDRRQFDVQGLRRKAIPFESERRERYPNNFRYRLERLPSERIRLDEQHRYKGDFRNLDRNRRFRFDERIARDYFEIEKDTAMFRRRNRNSDSRMEWMQNRRFGRNGEVSRERDSVRSIGSNLKHFFQYVCDWAALINSSLSGISNYLFTIIAGLFILDTVGQFIPVKANDEKGFPSLFRNFASVTGNVMVH